MREIIDKTGQTPIFQEEVDCLYEFTDSCLEDFANRNPARTAPQIGSGAVNGIGSRTCSIGSVSEGSGEIEPTKKQPILVDTVKHVLEFRDADAKRT